MRILVLVIGFLTCSSGFAQVLISGSVANADGEPLPYANVFIESSTDGSVSDEHGNFQLKTRQTGAVRLIASYVGYLNKAKELNLESGKNIELTIELLPSPELQAVVVTGTLTEMSRKESPVSVEVYSPEFFEKNPSPSIFESLHQVNGVRPQINCNVCNTGDIHINGLEGPYTMVTMDGMPVVSGLSSVYGLMGIPNSMIERVEIIKGPASSLYGSEAIGGVINVITKDPSKHPVFAGDFNQSSWNESTMNFSFKNKLGKKTDLLSGLHVYHYNNPIDNNGDNFTDLTLSKRISFFQKVSFERPSNRRFNIGYRFYAEDRWGGDMNWNENFRGGDSIYGESIYTRRGELMSEYQLPMHEKITIQSSFVYHFQDSYYGDVPFMARQQIAFLQAVWEKKLGVHLLTSGLAVRSNYFDDNTAATATLKGNEEVNEPDLNTIPGMFIQDDIELTESSRLLLGFRYDHHSVHGDIWTPRMAYKFKLNENNIFRVNAGTGFRVVNIFTEEHAALTGARQVVFEEELLPEQSFNVNMNYFKTIYSNGGNYWGLDLSVFYNRFSNQIIPDYDTDPNLIIYQNLSGYSISRGFGFNLDAVFSKNIRFLGGFTYTDVFQMSEQEDGLKRISPVLTERFSAKWTLTYTIPKYRTSVDYTASLYGPMRLPILGPLDPRAEYSPWWSIQNIQVSHYLPDGRWEFFGGVKNLLNYLPPSNSIARAHDPFDKEVEFDQNGDAIVTANNPYALTFDPSYVFAPNQGIRFYLGLRFKIL